MKHCIIAIIPKESAQSVIDNLTEQDFSENDISLLMKDTAKARVIISDSGPLKGISLTTLKSFLLQTSVSNATVYERAIIDGNAVIAVYVTDETVATIQESLKDNDGTYIKTIK